MTHLHSELTNLLPRSSMRALRREYFIRLITVALGLVTVALIVHAILLFPAYLYAHSQVSTEQQQLEKLTASATSAEQQSVNDQISSVKSDISYIGRFTTLPTASGAVRAVIAVPHSGISLNGFTFTGPAADSKDAQMTVSGTAETRDALRAYVDSLGQQSYIKNADLPISAYAKDHDIPFTITLTGTLLP